MSKTVRIFNLPAIFGMFERNAKDPVISDDDIVGNLGRLLQDTDYQRSPYQMEFEGFFRARKGSFNSIEQACSEFGNIEKISYPHPRFARLSRCNLDHEPIFYCSIENGVPIFEVRPNVKEYVVLSRFKPKNESKLHILLPIVGVTQLRDSLSKLNRDDKMVKLLEKDLTYKSKHSYALEVDKQIARWFVAEVDDSNTHIYRLTRAYYKALLTYATFGDEKVHALLYPSVGSNISGFNIAMETRIVDENLSIDGAIIYQVFNKANNTYYLTPLKETDYIKENGDIIWKDTDLPDWTLDPKTPTTYI